MEKLENLKLIRKKRKLTRKELAELSGVNENTIQALETGITNVNNVKLSTLIALAQSLKVKVINLLPNELHKIIK